VVIVEPSFLALTSTPSIAPSSLEDTCPLSAVCAEAPIVNGIANTQARLTVLKSALRRMVVLSLDDLPPCWHISESRDRGVGLQEGGGGKKGRAARGCRRCLLKGCCGARRPRNPPPETR